MSYFQKKELNSVWDETERKRQTRPQEWLQYLATRKTLVNLMVDVWKNYEGGKRSQ